MRKLKILFTAVSLAGLTSIHAQTPPQNIADDLQQILQDALPGGFSNPGAVMGVVVPGQWSWYGAAGSGIAGISGGQPATVAQVSSRFRAGSITKSMVATCILKLEQDGLISINDPIGDYLRPTLLIDTLMSSATVTIRHLLNHTSGIANSAANAGCQMNILADPLASHSIEEAIWCGASQGELFTPGTDWAYSNTNYSLLAMIIQEVTGSSYTEYLDQTIIQPLSLDDTEIPTTDQISGDHMGCYWYINGLGWVDLTIIDATTYTGWADLVSSTADLLTYYQNLLEGNIINTTQLDKMKTIDAAANNYGLGMEFHTVDLVPYYGHYGEVANTNGMLYFELNSALAPNGFYLVYDFNTQGVPMITDVDRPVYHLLKGDLGIESMAQGQVTIYPVPSDGNVWVELGSNLSAEKIEVCDINGRNMNCATVLTANDKYEMFTKDLIPGTYTLVIHTTDGVIRKHLVLQ